MTERELVERLIIRARQYEAAVRLGGRFPVEAEKWLERAKAALLERLSSSEVTDALEFYAREYNWRSMTVYMCGHGAINCNAMADKGAKARAAITAMRSAATSERKG